MTTFTKNSKPSGKRPTPVPDGWLEIGTIVSAQGLRGEVRVSPQTDFPERFEQPGKRWLLAPDSDTPDPVQLQRGRLLPGKALFVVKLEGVDDRNQAEALRHYRLLVTEGDRLPLDEDEYHVADLIGLRVIDQATQTFLGTVTDVLPAGNDLLEVALLSEQEPAPKVLIPFVPEIVPTVAIEQGFVEILPPPGLLNI